MLMLEYHAWVESARKLLMLAHKRTGKYFNKQHSLLPCFQGGNLVMIDIGKLPTCASGTRPHKLSHIKEGPIPCHLHAEQGCSAT
jgi:hypothetical protein